MSGKSGLKIIVKKNMTENYVLDTSNEKRHWVRITYICNQNCLFCLDSDERGNTHLSLADIEKDLRTGLKNNAKRAVISGGDASIHPQFIEVIKLAKKIGYEHIQTITNGQKFADEVFFDDAIKAGLDEITFSIHGPSSKIHDYLVGVKGAFIKVLKALKHCKKYPRLIVSIDVCVNKVNIKYLPEILKKFIDVGFYEFDILHITPFGSAWDNRDVLLYDVKSNLKYLHKALEFSKDPKTHIWTNRLPAKFLEGYESLIQDPRKLYDEVNGRKKMFDDFIKKNIPMFCLGKICEYCFIKDFCSDLKQLVDKGELLSSDVPKCLNNTVKKEGKKITRDELLSSEEVNLSKFIDFFIEERYNVKSLRCDKCIENTKCSGSSVNLIKEKGFKILEIKE